MSLVKFGYETIKMFPQSEPEKKNNTLGENQKILGKQLYPTLLLLNGTNGPKISKKYII